MEMNEKIMDKDGSVQPIIDEINRKGEIGSIVARYHLKNITLNSVKDIKEPTMFGYDVREFIAGIVPTIKADFNCRVLYSEKTSNVLLLKHMTDITKDIEGFRTNRLCTLNPEEMKNAFSIIKKYGDTLSSDELNKLVFGK